MVALLTEYFEELEAWVLSSCDIEFANEVLSQYQHRIENEEWMQLVTENLLIDDSPTSQMCGKFLTQNQDVVKILLLQYRI